MNLQSHGYREKEMGKDKQHKTNPISDGLAPPVNLCTIATGERFVSDAKVQKQSENATRKHKHNAGCKGVHPTIHSDGQYKVNKSV
jgi:hypothetical protein